MISLLTKSYILSVLRLVTFIHMEGNAEFQLAVGENKDAIFFHPGSWVL